LLPFLAQLEHPFVIDHMGYLKASDGHTDGDVEALLAMFGDNENCWIKLSGPYRLAPGQPLSSSHELGRALVATCPDRLLWGSDWPHLPDGQRDTGELLNLLADWAPDPDDRRTILVDAPQRLFFDGPG
jgi:predicted TIM-barrel fold metal-dependent hydrolase